MLLSQRVLLSSLLLFEGETLLPLGKEVLPKRAISLLSTREEVLPYEVVHVPTSEEKEPPLGARHASV